MASTSLRSVASRPNPQRVEADVPVVSTSPPKRRRPSWALGGAVMIVAAALLGAYVFSVETSKVSVMVAAHDLEPGLPIGAGDLRVVQIGMTGELRAIQPDQQGLILGQTPRAAIPAGTVLNTGLFVAAGEAVPQGQVVVGASFAAGEVPTPRLRTGDLVQLLEVAPTAGGAADAASLDAVVLGAATVWAVTGSADPGASTSKVWVSLLVTVGLQTQVAQAAADGRLRLALGGGP